MTMATPRGETSTGNGAEGRRPAPPKPTPVIENKGLTAPFWEGAKRHALMMQRCRTCSNFIFYPREQCPNCFSQDLEWQQVSGKGRVYAFTNVYQPAHPAFTDEAPYCFAVVQLDEGGIRMPTNIIGCKPEDVRVDMPVIVEFDDVSPEWTLVKFRPA
jgi:uncharacterized OB-fold protein